MPRKRKEQLDVERQKYLRLNALTNEPGWIDLQSYLQEAFVEALEILQNPKYVKQELEARGIIKFIKEFTDKLNSDMQFGKKAQIEYVKTYLQPPGE